MTLGPYLSPFFDVTEMDAEQQALDHAMRRLHAVISDAMDREFRENRRRRIELIVEAALWVFVSAMLIGVLA